MKIYFFTRDIVYYAGVSIDGKRHICGIWEQAGKLYVTIGMAITGDLRRHDFTPEQSKAYRDFVISGKTNEEFFNIGGI